MKIGRFLRTLAGAALLVGAASGAHAATNPNPDVFQDDTGMELFFPSSGSMVFQVSNPLLAAFGFFYADAPDTRIALMGPGDAAAGNIALVNFDTGRVIDLDDGFSLQNIFTPRSAPIGFYIQSLSGTVISSVSAMNGGLDLVSVFPTIGTGSRPHLFIFEVPIFGPISAQAVANLTAVPEPAVWMTLLAGLGLVGWQVRRSRAAHAA